MVGPLCVSPESRAAHMQMHFDGLLFTDDLTGTARA